MSNYERTNFSIKQMNCSNRISNDSQISFPYLKQISSLLSVGFVECSYSRFAPPDPLLLTSPSERIFPKPTSLSLKTVNQSLQSISLFPSFPSFHSLEELQSDLDFPFLKKFVFHSLPIRILLVTPCTTPTPPPLPTPSPSIPTAFPLLVRFPKNDPFYHTSLSQPTHPQPTCLSQPAYLP